MDAVKKAYDRKIMDEEERQISRMIFDEVVYNPDMSINSYEKYEEHANNKYRTVEYYINIINEEKKYAEKYCKSLASELPEFSMDDDILKLKKLSNEYILARFSYEIELTRHPEDLVIDKK